VSRDSSAAKQDPFPESPSQAPQSYIAVDSTSNIPGKLQAQFSTTTDTSTSGAPAIRKAAQRLHVHQSVYFPNLPLAPVNGMIKTYGTQHRTFTRPHSAKTVFFYKDNDVYYTVGFHLK
jgi:hypothetical protein